MSDWTIKHTPGDWNVGESHPECIYDNKGNRIGYADQRKNHPDERYANARLMAAAPDLLEACQGALNLLTDSPIENSPTADILRAAIAKATGE